MALVTDADEVELVTTESIGGITNEVALTAYTPGDTEAILPVEVTNYGDIPTSYYVTVMSASDPNIMLPPAQAVWLDASDKATLNFPIHSAAALDPDTTFDLVLASPTGRIYDENTFPNP